MSVIILFVDFFATRKWGYLISLMIAIVVGVIFYKYSQIAKEGFDTLVSGFVNVIGILLGFSISVLTVFITSNNNNIELSKDHDINRNLWKRQYTLYDRIIIDVCYIILFLGVLLMSSFIVPNLLCNCCRHPKLLFISIAISVLMHIIYMILSIASDLYLIVSKKK